MFVQTIDACLTFAAGRGRLLRGLIEGDPTAWTFLGIAVVAVIGWSIFKSKFYNNE